MRLFILGLIAISPAVFAQRGGAGGGGARGGGPHPGGGGGPHAGPGISHGAYFGHSGRGAVLVPYPVYFGTPYYGFAPYGGYGYDPSAYAGAGYAGYDPSQQYYYQQGDAGYAQSPQAPAVVINQNYQPETANPVLRDYSNVPLPEPTFKKFEAPSSAAIQGNINDEQPTVYLIAMRDHTILPALGYWVDGDTLNYITVQGSYNRASLSLVDREFSQKLNDERHVDFHLPPAK